MRDKKYFLLMLGMIPGVVMACSYASIWFKYDDQAYFQSRHHFYDNPLLQAYAPPHEQSVQRHPRYGESQNILHIVDSSSFIKELQRTIQVVYPEVEIGLSAPPVPAPPDSGSPTGKTYWQMDAVESLDDSWRLITYGACVSNKPSAVLGLVEAAGNSGVDATALQHIVQARVALLFGCGELPLGNQFDQHIAALKAHAKYDVWRYYLLAGKALYAEQNYQQALRYIESLLEANVLLKRDVDKNRLPQDAWLIETAHYLLGRFALLIAQKDLPSDGWGYASSPSFQNTIKQNWVNRAETYFEDYQKAYLKGRYVGSALAFQQRIARFRDQEVVAVTYDIMQQVPADQQATWLLLIRQLHQNDDSHIVTQQLQTDLNHVHPLVLAYWLNRYPDTMAQPIAALLQQDLTEAIKAKFVPYPGLYEALLVEAHYQQGNHQAAASVIMPLVYPKLLAQQVKQRQAESWLALGQSERARTIWQQLRTDWQQDLTPKLVRHYSEYYDNDYVDPEPEYQYPPQLYGSGVARSPYELDIAATYVQQQDYHSLVRDITHPIILDEVLNQLCDNEQLLTIATDTTLSVAAQNEAREALFMNGIRQEKFAWLASNFHRIPKREYFSDIEPAIGRLAVEPNHVASLSKIATYLMNNQYLQPLPTADERLRPPVNACDSDKHFGTLHYFTRIVALHNDVTDADGKMLRPRSLFEAKALHFLAIDKNDYGDTKARLYGNTDELVPSSKASYIRLYERYPNSSWKQETPYYYDKVISWTAVSVNHYPLSRYRYFGQPHQHNK